jgi:hypothetical protein
MLVASSFVSCITTQGRKVKLPCCCIKYHCFLVIAAWSIDTVKGLSNTDVLLLLRRFRELHLGVNNPVFASQVVDTLCGTLAHGAGVVLCNNAAEHGAS